MRNMIRQDPRCEKCYNYQYAGCIGGLDDGTDCEGFCPDELSEFGQEEMLIWGEEKHE